MSNPCSATIAAFQPKNKLHMMPINVLRDALPSWATMIVGKVGQCVDSHTLQCGFCLPRKDPANQECSERHYN